jgi:hypothetical protein
MLKRKIDLDPEKIKSALVSVKKFGFKWGEVKKRFSIEKAMAEYGGVKPSRRRRQLNALIGKIRVLRELDGFLLETRHRSARDLARELSVDHHTILKWRNFFGHSTQEWRPVRGVASIKAVTIGGKEKPLRITQKEIREYWKKTRPKQTR